MSLRILNCIHCKTDHKMKALTDEFRQQTKLPIQSVDEARRDLVSFEYTVRRMSAVSQRISLLHSVLVRVTYITLKRGNRVTNSVCHQSQINVHHFVQRGQLSNSRSCTCCAAPRHPRATSCSSRGNCHPLVWSDWVRF